jgi:hypothetical protein
MRHNYLNNKDILKEIHRSKSTYCWFAIPEDADYDMIITEPRKILKKDLAVAKKARAERLAKLAQDAATAEGRKTKLDEHTIKLSKIADTDVVFRMMTWEHIPIDTTPKKTKATSKKAAAAAAAALLEDDEDDLLTEYDLPIEEPKLATKYMKVNFPPFKHFKFNEEGEPVCCGISHWKGDPESGVFSRDHGNMTKKLALMFMKLCERYATRSNWRGYTYNDEMRSQALLQLSQIGLQFDESKSQNPFAYYTAAITNSFTRVLNIEKRNQNLRDDILQANGLNPSYTRQGMAGGGGLSGGGSYEE